MPQGHGSVPVQGTSECGTPPDGFPVAVQGCAGGIPVPVTASIPDCVKVKPCGAGTATRTNVARTNATVTLLAANSARQGAIVHNNSGELLFVALGTGGTKTDFSILLTKDSFWEVPFDYTGIITGAWKTNGGGNAQITEIT